MDTSGTAYDQDITDRLLSMPGHAQALPRVDSAPVQQTLSDDLAPAQQNMLDFAAANVPIPPELQQQIDQQKARVITDLESRNLSFFTQETEKLDAWADDLKVGLEREIKELDRNIKEARTKSKGAATLADKLQAQKEQRDLEAQRDKKRRELFNRQDEIQGRRDQLIEELEAQLGQQLSQRTLFSCEWEVL
jgi:exonuclease VII large subunit